MLLVHLMLIFLFPLNLQPDNPAELGRKLYEMMSTALSGKWAAPPAEMHHEPVQSQTAETLEAEVVESNEAGGQK